jgi:hypothetical protein
MVFERDRQALMQAFPEWGEPQVRPMMPFVYLISGGVSMRSLMPGWAYPLWAGVERLLSPWGSRWAMFAAVMIEKGRAS